MNVISYQPWTVVRRLHRDTDAPTGKRGLGHEDVETVVSDWVPAVDITEYDNKFVLRADLPGVDPAEIELSMDAGELTLSGQRAAPETESDATSHRKERRSGRFVRSFNLPETVDAEAITATGANGVLEIHIPKQAKVLPRRITVNAA